MPDASFNPRYYAGKPCPHGHSGLRYRSNNVCVPCMSEYNSRPEERAKKRARAKAAYSLEKRREAQLKESYGMSVAEYTTMLQKQHGRCTICGTSGSLESRKRLHVDHDHATGRVRALLCQACNQGLGNFRDDPERLHNAIKYLTEHSHA